jgi:hypothetical protein
MSQKFRPPMKSWLGSSLVVLFLAVVFILGPYYLIGSPLRYTGFILGPLAILFFIREVCIPMIRTYVVIDNATFSGRVEQGAFRIHWANIQVAQINMDRQYQYHVWLIITQNVLDISLKYLDPAPIWRLIRKHVAPEALESKTLAHWLRDDEAFQKLEVDNNEFVQRIGETYKVRPKTWMVVIAWVMMVMCLSIAVSLWVMRVPGCEKVSPGLVVLALLAGLNVLPDNVEMDAEAVTHIIPPFGRFRMRWDEIGWIEVDLAGYWMVIHGKDKSLSMMGPSIWSGRDRDLITKLFTIQVEQRRIDIFVNPAAQLKLFSRNTRVQ